MLQNKYFLWLLEFLSTGPGIVFWVYGIFRSRPGEALFGYSVQSMMHFALVAAVWVLWGVIGEFWGRALTSNGWVHSVIAAFYVLGGVMNFLSFRKGNAILLPWAQRVVDKVSDF